MTDDYVPAISISMGEFLKEELELRNWTREDFSKKTGLKLEEIDHLMDGDAIIMQDLSILLGKIFDEPADYWLNLSKNHQRNLLRIKEKEAEKGKVFREKLSQYIHDIQWSGWMKYLFSKCVKQEVHLPSDYMNNEFDKIKIETVIPEWAVERWTRQMNTPYDQLSEEEKNSDREEADKIIALILEEVKAHYENNTFYDGYQETWYGGHDEALDKLTESLEEK